MVSCRGAVAPRAPAATRDDDPLAECRAIHPNVGSAAPAASCFRVPGNADSGAGAAGAAPVEAPAPTDSRVVVGRGRAGPAAAADVDLQDVAGLHHDASLGLAAQTARGIIHTRPTA